MNAARFFMRREDYQPPQTPPDSPFRRFVVHCLKCGSYRLRVIGEPCEETGETNVYLYCPACHAREKLPVW
jgi:hypothetical protein